MAEPGRPPSVGLDFEEEGTNVDEKETPRDDSRLNLHDESGMTRRDLMRRGAIVGGTLLWVAPAIQSIGSKAYAQVGQGPSPGNCAACYCYNVDTDGNLVADECSENGVVSATHPERFSNDACQISCQAGGFDNHQYCSGTSPNCCCRQGTIGGAIGEIDCVSDDCGP
jgi:hypothetical protein